MPTVSRTTVFYQRPDNTQGEYTMVVKYDGRIARRETQRSYYDHRNGKPFSAELPKDIAEKKGQKYIYGATELDLHEQLKKICDEVAEQRTEERDLIVVQMKRSYAGGRHMKLDPDRTGAELQIKWEVVRETKTYRGGALIRTENLTCALDKNGAIITRDGYRSSLLTGSTDHEYDGIRVFDYSQERIERIKGFCLALTEMAEKVDAALEGEKLELYLDGKLGVKLLEGGHFPEQEMTPNHEIEEAA